MVDNTSIAGGVDNVGATQGFTGISILYRDEDMGPRFGIVPTMTTAWMFTEAERKLIAEGAPLIISLWGNTWPPCMIQVGEFIKMPETEGNG